jgi:3-methyladenine DNA glycosylase AlkD
MTIEEIIGYFEEFATPKKREFDTKLYNSSVPCLGCPVPVVRKLAKTLTVEDVLELPYHVYNEVDMLKGIVFGGCKLPLEYKFPLLFDFATHIENWAVCDVCGVKFSVAERQQYFDFFVKLTSDSRPFVVRYGLGGLLSHFLDQKHIEKVLATVENVTFGHYYVDMMAAWLVATAFAKCPVETRQYLLTAKNISTFAYNKALQKIRDSFRVSKEDKEWTRGLRR